MTLFFTSFSLSLSLIWNAWLFTAWFQVSVLLPARLVFPLVRDWGGGRAGVAVEGVALLSVRGQESLQDQQTLRQATGHQYFKHQKKHSIFFFNFLLLKYWWETLAEKNLTFQANMGEVPPIRRARLLSWRTPLSDWTLLLSPPTFLPSVSPANKKTSPFGCFRQDRGLEGRKLEQKIRKRI